MKLLIATRNRDKVKEIGKALQIADLELISAADIEGLPEVVEDADTLVGNAEKKARECALHTGLWSLADDTGLEVDALDGAPGVYTARYAGPNATYADNVNHLLHELGDNPNRKACFKTAIALSSPDGKTEWVVGECRGIITTSVQGDGGFGYDPIFQPNGHSQTFAEMSLDEKNTLSHRGRALKKAVETWGQKFSGNA